jgi:hypothetical protein
MHFSPPLLRFDSEDWPVIFGYPEVTPQNDFQRRRPEVGFEDIVADLLEVSGPLVAGP